MKKSPVFLVLSLNLLLSQGFSDSLAIIGGEGEDAPYAAFVSSLGIATQITGEGLPLEGEVNGVSINSLGAAILGGQTAAFTPFAAVVSPSGVATAITGDAPTGSGSINAVAINNLGAGIIGGTDNGFARVYAAVVSSSGIATEITGAGVPINSGAITVVSINDSGIAIIGGSDNDGNDPYAAVVSPAGVTTEVAGPQAPSGNGTIIGVAINNAGNAIIGGTDNNYGASYAALVSSEAVPTRITGDGIPVEPGTINAVAINGSGAAIIGGRDNGDGFTFDPYAAFVSPAGETTKILGVGTGKGEILAVAINSSGNGVIGGQDNDSNDAYAALVSSSGTLTAITGDAPSGPGTIFSVAIDDSGAALVGGRDSAGDLYAAVVSPLGIATEVSGGDIPSIGLIQSVSLRSVEAPVPILVAVVPTSFGPGSSFANSLFALSSEILPNHLSSRKANRSRAFSSNSLGQSEVGLLASASDDFQETASDSGEISPKDPFRACLDTTKYSLWLAPFGDYAHQKKQGAAPSIDNWIGGAVVGFDYRGMENTVIGCGAAYAYSYARLAEKLGHSKTNQEFLTLYGSWMGKHFYIDLSLWAGAYQMENERHSIGAITSTSDVDGWLLNPHLEISTPFYIKGDWFLLDPFAMFDWANNWQDRIREKGASGFNLRIEDLYTSLLRTEVGLRFYESMEYGWGLFVLQEKASWVNKLPFGASPTQAIFVGGVSSFAVEVFSDKTQNLGAIQLSAWFFPENKKYPYGSLNYQGEMGSSFQNHLISFEIGKDF